MFIWDNTITIISIVTFINLLLFIENLIFRNKKEKNNKNANLNIYIKDYKENKKQLVIENTNQGTATILNCEFAGESFYIKKENKEIENINYSVKNPFRENIRDKIVGKSSYILFIADEKTDETKNKFGFGYYINKGKFHIEYKDENNKKHIIDSSYI